MTHCLLFSISSAAAKYMTGVFLYFSHPHSTPHGKRRPLTHFSSWLISIRQASKFTIQSFFFLSRLSICVDLLEHAHRLNPITNTSGLRAFLKLLSRFAVFSKWQVQGRSSWPKVKPYKLTALRNSENKLTTLPTATSI